MQFFLFLPFLEIADPQIKLKCSAIKIQYSAKVHPNFNPFNIREKHTQENEKTLLLVVLQLLLWLLLPPVAVVGK